MAKLDIAPGYGPGDWGFESLQARLTGVGKVTETRSAVRLRDFFRMPIPEEQSALYDSWMALAIREADRAEESGDIPIGCIIVLKNRVIGRAHNQIELLKDATAHAEMIAITQAEEYIGDWRLNGAVLVVTKEPCPMCAGAILQSRISTVVYGARAPRDGAAGSALDLLNNPILGSSVTCVGGVREEECLLLLKDFFKDLRQSSNPGNKRKSPGPRSC